VRVPRRRARRRERVCRRPAREEGSQTGCQLLGNRSRRSENAASDNNADHDAGPAPEPIRRGRSSFMQRYPSRPSRAGSTGVPGSPKAPVTGLPSSGAPRSADTRSDSGCSRGPDHENQRAGDDRLDGAELHGLSATIAIGDARIGPKQRVYTVAEAGVNHNGTWTRRCDWSTQPCRREPTPSSSRRSGRPTCDRGRRHAGYQRSATGSTSQREMLARLELTRDGFAALRRHCRACGIEFLCTPFSVGDCACC